MIKIISEIFSFKTPKFWHSTKSFGGYLVPLSVLYFFLKRFYLLFKKSTEQKFKFKTIFIGNLTMGGAGKTPAAIAIAHKVHEIFPNKKIVFISTAYKSKIKNPTLVLPSHTAEEIGDEAKILSQYFPTIISKNRLQGCVLAESENFEVAIFDDGLHDARIHKDLKIVVIDGAYGIGNGFVFPAGPLKDRLDIAMHDASNILLIGKDAHHIIPLIASRMPHSLSIYNSYIDFVGEYNKNLSYTAFAGIARPEKFFNSLAEANLNVINKVEFADHYHYTDEDFSHLIELAKANNTTLITTEKDFVKLSDELKAQTICFKISLEFDGEFNDTSIETLLSKTIKK